MPLEDLLTAKNTFLDCGSPWLEPVDLPQRPSSDPGPSAESSSACASTSEAPSEAGRTCGHPSSADAPSGGVLSLADTAGSAAGPAGPAEHSRAAGEAEGGPLERLTRTERRRMQRKLAKEQGAWFSGASAPAAAHGPAPGGPSPGKGAGGVGAAPARGTKVSL